MLELDAPWDAFRGRSVLVTGHTGFKGSWLCLWLHRLGARVTGYGLAPPTDPNLFTMCRIPELLHEHHEADIRDEQRLLAAMRKAEPDVVFHLAAETIVRRSYRIPRETFDVNVMGTVSVLECVRVLRRPCAVVAVTSDKCYENHEHVWGHRESDPMGERDPYGASKGAAELVIRSYRHSFFPPEELQRHGVRLASARAGNVIGGGDFTQDALVVDAVTALARRQPVRVRNPGALRPWQHVLAALSGYLQLAARLLESDDPRWSSGWNFGPLPGNDLPVRQMVERLIGEWGEGSWTDVSDPTQPHEAHSLRLAIDKALCELGWRPLWDIERALYETVRWYRAHFQGLDDMSELSKQQIDAYEQSGACLLQAGTST